MDGRSYTIRDDERYTVVVGWEEGLETFYAYVFDHADGNGKEPVWSVGHEPHEVPTISQLVTAVGRFADLDVSTVSTLRHDAQPLS